IEFVVGNAMQKCCLFILIGAKVQVRDVQYFEFAHCSVMRSAGTTCGDIHFLEAKPLRLHASPVQQKAGSTENSTSHDTTGEQRPFVAVEKVAQRALVRCRCHLSSIFQKFHQSINSSKRRCSKVLPLGRNAISGAVRRSTSHLNGKPSPIAASPNKRS